ncbi:hypothetical protein HDE68_003043 [Pedobacter cryoconitis]|uniref:Thiol-activated cytolysin n=1 Tax=Pedobacter cryoconitis TaxID=188932 RepID=A0A7W8ZNN5_9SPHI|nr:hypothetical protein [Pedobacter cryoconitis]MBB5637130.1 hypothetical protein [Pedobacter cryoconitis]
MLKSNYIFIIPNYLFISLFTISLLACKKDTPVNQVPVSPAEVIVKKNYSDYEFQNMAAKSGYYIIDTIWNKDKISDIVIRKNFENEFLYPINGDYNALYLGSPIDGKYFMENKGVFKSYTRYTRNPLRLVTTNAYNFNAPNFRLDVPVNNLAGMDSLVREYLKGAKPSLFGFSRYEYYHFSNYNELKLLFGENSDIRNLFKISSNTDLEKVENGLVYYNRKETFSLRMADTEKDFFKQPYSLDVLKNEESGFIDKVTYGKISIMTIDAKLDWREISKIIQNVTGNLPVSDSDLKKLSTAKVYTYLRGYSAVEQTKLNNNLGNVLETIKTFSAITSPPSNFVNSGTFSYEDCGVPIAFELRNTYSSDKFLKNFNYPKTINFN